MKLVSVSIFTSNLEKALYFYESILGFEREERDSCHILFSDGLEIFSSSFSSSSDIPKFLLTFETLFFDSLIEKLKANNIEIITQDKLNNQRFLIIKDFDGNTLRIIEHKDNSVKLNLSELNYTSFKSQHINNSFFDKTSSEI